MRGGELEARDGPRGDVSRPRGDAAMLDVFQGFVHELRAAGLPVSMTENLDAMRAVEHVSFADRDALKSALAATLVKHHGHWKVFDTVFDVYFSFLSRGVDGDGADGDGADGDAAAQLAAMMMQAANQGGGAMGDVSNEDLARMLIDAMMNMNRDALRAIAGAAVTRFAGMEPGRPVGGAYYLYRTLRQLDAEGLVAKLMAQAQAQGDIGDGDLD